MFLIQLFRLLSIRLPLGTHIVPVNVVDVHRAWGILLLKFDVPVQVFHYVQKVREQTHVARKCIVFSDPLELVGLVSEDLDVPELLGIVVANFAIEHTIF